MLDKIHNRGKDKRKEYETKFGIVSYKRKGDSNNGPRKRKYKPYEET